jgi:hypothetical protein
MEQFSGTPPTTWPQCLFPKAQISRCSLPDWLPLLREEVEAMNFDPAYPALPFDKLHRTDLLSLFINEVRPRAHPATTWWRRSGSFPSPPLGQSTTDAPVLSLGRD